MKMKKALAGVVLAGSALVPLTVAASPASATSACDYQTRTGYGIFGAYVGTSAGSARSSCATVVQPQRLASNRVTFSGWAKDSATDTKNAALYAQFRVNGVWGSPRIIHNSGSESWHTWSYPVTASGTVDMMAIQACAWSASGGLESCGTVTTFSGF